MPAREFHVATVRENLGEPSSTVLDALASRWEGGVWAEGLERTGSAQAEGWAGPGTRGGTGGDPERPGRAEDEEEGVAGNSDTHTSMAGVGEAGVGCGGDRKRTRGDLQAAESVPGCVKVRS